MWGMNIKQNEKEKLGGIVQFTIKYLSIKIFPSSFQMIGPFRIFEVKLYIVLKFPTKRVQ